MGIYDSIIKDAQSAIDFNEFEKFKLQSQKSNRELSAGQNTIKKLMIEITNKSLNNVPISKEEMQALTVAALGSGWIKLHPESANVPENMTFSQMKPSLSPSAMKNQADAGFAWEATNWNGACDQLAKIAKPTLVITGTDDNNYIPHANALVIAGKIPGAWLVQIKNAGHAIADQYPAELGKIMNTFLSTTANSG